LIIMTAQFNYQTFPLSPPKPLPSDKYITNMKHRE